MAKAIKKLGLTSVLDSLMDYRTFFDLANVIMVIIDSKQKIVLINSKGCEVLGCPVGGAEGKNWFETFLPKEEFDKMKHIFSEMMKGRAEPFIHYENYVLNQKGEKRLINWHNTYLKDEKGRIRYTLSSGVDITDYEKAKQDLKKSQTKYKRLFEESNDAIFVIDKQTNIVDVNRAACRLIGYSKSDFLKLSILDVVFEEDFSMNKKKAQQAFKKGFGHFQARLIKSNGRMIYVDVNAKVIDKKKGLLLGIIRNMTQQKVKETKEKENLLKEIKSLNKLNQAYHGRIKNMENKLSRLENRLKTSGKKRSRPSFKRKKY